MNNAGFPFYNKDNKMWNGFEGGGFIAWLYTGNGRDETKEYILPYQGEKSAYCIGRH